MIGVPTSEATRIACEREGIRLATLDELPELDLTIDGADECDGQLRLIKGGGAALLREKIVAVASRRMVVIADAAKRVETLGAFPCRSRSTSSAWARPGARSRRRWPRAAARASGSPVAGRRGRAPPHRWRPCPPRRASGPHPRSGRPLGPALGGARRGRARSVPRHRRHRLPRRGLRHAGRRHRPRSFVILPAAPVRRPFRSFFRMLPRLAVLAGLLLAMGAPQAALAQAAKPRRPLRSRPPNPAPPRRKPRRSPRSPPPISPSPAKS